MQPQSSDYRTSDQLHAEAQRLSSENRTGEALSILTNLAQTNPDNTLFQNDLGVLRYQSGDREGAKNAYERAVALQPSSANCRKNLADLYFTEFGMTDEAIRIYLELFKEQPRDLETVAGLGHICTAVGRPDEARSFFRRALEIEPWNRDVREALNSL